MSYLTRPSNVRVYQFRQPPLLRRRILPVQTPKDHLAKVPAEGFEPPTLCSEDRCSGPLS
jgi:hypothetical protein